MTPPVDFTARLSTGSWGYVLTPVHGITVYEKVIVIEPSAETRTRLDTFIHETLHASTPSLRESEVVRIAGDVARVLWKAGYRRSTK